MEDIDLIHAFVHDGARSGFSTNLHVEGDTLMVEGWWPAVYRVAPAAFIIRVDEPPMETSAPDMVKGVLAAAGMGHVGTDLPGITQLTYSAQFSLGYVPWDMWAPDLEWAEAALSARTSEESFLESPTSRGNGAGDFTTEFGGARRVAGLPPSIVLSVGVDGSSLAPLEALMPDCHFIAKAFGEIQPDSCGALIPTVMIVDGTTTGGREFMTELRAAACGRTIPVLAVTDQGVPLGANASIDPSAPAEDWVKPITELLP